MTEVRIEPATPATLADYATVPIAFEVRSRFDQEGLLQHRLIETPVDPWVKDYDRLEDPVGWPERFDMTHWRLVSAWENGHRVGGAVLAGDTNGVDMLEGRNDLAVIWDVRVAPSHRAQGVGRLVLAAVAGLARARRYRELKVETQDINVPACRFYGRQGFSLSEVNPGAYPGLEEIQMIWRMRLVTR